MYADITKMKYMVRENKDRCRRAFHEDYGLQSSCKVMGWVRDLSGKKERMRSLKGSNGG